MTHVATQARTPRRRRQSVAAASPTAHSAGVTSTGGPVTEQPRSSSDLRALEEWCDRALTRCSKHERDIDKLRHDIDDRMQRWDELTVNLRTSDDRAKQLVSQLQTALRTLRTSTTSQVSAAKSATAAAERRVDQSKLTLEAVRQSIEQSSVQVDALEQQLLEEEQTQTKVDTTRNVIFWLSVFAVALVSSLAVFLLKRHQH
ncbi:hypothetical protein ACM66B_003664 [Microbotryomycetes sp. NB124-2]